jgi:serine/threonine protein kinase
VTVMGGEIRVGEILRERYEIQELIRSVIGKRIYRALDRRLNREMAVDVFSRNVTLPNGMSVGAWEAQVLTRLDDHPNIATVQDQWEDGGVAVMVTRYLVGGNLLDRIARAGTLSPDCIVRISTEIAQALAYIHRHGILYRDLQPRNVLFDDRGTVHLVDFDTAVPLDDHDMSDLSDRRVIEYMAPELTAGQAAGERADLYSLGATMYEMACGHPPFTGNRAEILASRRAGPAPYLGRDDLPKALRDLVARLLAFAPDQRPASADDVLTALGALNVTRPDIGQLLASDESATLEFKPWLRTPADVAGAGPGKHRMFEKAVLKSIAAFLNTDGGTLVVGVTDEREIRGIEVDFPHAAGSLRDSWRKTFDDLVSRHLGGQALGCIDLWLEPWCGRTIAVIRCTPSAEPVWIDDELFVRRTASTEKLSTRKAISWCHQHWGAPAA